MKMEDVFGKLREYQELLTERVGIEKEIMDIPKALEAQMELLSRIKKAYTEVKEGFKATETKVHTLREELIQAETGRENAEKQMDVISTQREYEALSKEIRDAGEREQNLRRELQKEESNLAELEEALRRDEGMIQMQETEITEKKHKIDTERNSKTNRAMELKTKEKTASEGIDHDVLYKFERIIRSKQGLGIVAVRGTVCTGCHMMLPAQFVNEIRSGNRVIFCPYCSRVLFFQEADDQSEILFTDIESGSLSDLDYDSDDGEGDSDDDDSDDSDKQSDMEDSED